jgi:hypothetical protein
MNRRLGIWPRVPETVLGRDVPPRFRRFSARFTDPDRLLAQFMAWLESAPAPATRIAAAGEPARPLPPAPPAATAPTDVDDRAQRDRLRLIQACIDVGERVPQPALAARLTRAVEDAGVVSEDGAGQRFDPDRHHAIGQVATTDPVLHYHVADTARVGYRDGATVLRRPEVLVYVYEEQARE